MKVKQRKIVEQRIFGMITELNDLATRRKKLVDDLWLLEDKGQKLRVDLFKEIRALM